ncbi:YpjP family protein [Calidifontibacillus oryziterrae]|uniref:YpjP family protein n=1 Tax=Calidifontibacillus oryziterrae TaxID=1191699 RepID=UPI000300330F|nr:YpjP family protein [Calidifontibacillus oryziterrae]
MKLWMSKLFVVCVTILTFGMVVPQLPIELNKDVKDNSGLTDQSDRILVEDGLSEDEQDTTVEDSWGVRASLIDDYDQLISSFTAYSIVQAEQLSMMKFGKTIAPAIGDEFKEVILPKIEDAIASLTQQLDEQNVRDLEISEKPAGGLGEKIFHVYERKTGKDLIRFHVRRDHPPQQGYWFNFHYHTYADNFHNHHDMGSIYWDKNTPPYWMNT